MVDMTPSNTGPSIQSIAEQILAMEPQLNVEVPVPPEFAAFIAEQERRADAIDEEVFDLIADLQINEMIRSIAMELFQDLL
ncbi:hypothetical protein QR680_006922 [Steinernema hermaphroditum]|uniref:Uncharacterized protein n=1 Tax=Steinernema hermaphroditum TaxID=289476 RepID=A0AA39LY60_9BILA|nr:hypothetical protein QR680_006922 [Steinernema hermaphroditum]